MTVTTENISMESVVILIHQNALEEMLLREARLLRQYRRLQEDMHELGNEIRAKKFEIDAARDQMLRGVV